MKKIAIFGAGLYGKKALQELGSDRVECFIDNSSSKQGTEYYGKAVKSLDEVLCEKKEFEILIASTYSQSIENQLKEHGITEYTIFEDRLHGYFETEDLIVNPYETLKEAQSEQEWSGSERMQYTRKAVYDAVETFRENQPLFNHIEVETINRCNGNCSFCPVNRSIDPREKAIMTEELFKKIVDQLAEIDYDGRFTTFSNNEPLLDERIVALNRYAREHLPHARMHLFTNGTLFTLDKFIALTDILDELIIDNYQQNLELIKPCREIEAYCKEHPKLGKKVTIVLRKPDEILTSRGGTAPNRKELVQYGKDRCILPYKQMVVRPDGKVSLCCNDAVGKYTLGDVNKESLLDIWYGGKFRMVRKCLYDGRENWGNCKFCDTFLMG
ncbi:MAG: radical SAM protein [Lachnospiraceae bacterium]|nr:radical SAM protein [Lachnospiraceae bacterium]